MPKNIDLTGSFVNVRNTDLDEDIPHLYEICHLVPEAHPRIWDYMFYGPFASAQAMRACYDDVLKTDILLTVVNKTENKPVGLCAFLNIETKMGRLEIGHVLYPPCVQKTKTNTEATYLLLKHAFNDLQYRRVEWKCNNLNQDSKRTALRMGFQHEGIFHQHMIIKNKNRDTAWFALLDKDWPQRKTNFEKYLSGQALSLTELNLILT